jgi:hypothetical protein
MTSVSPSVFADSGDEFPLYGPFIIEPMDGKIVFFHFKSMGFNFWGYH